MALHHTQDARMSVADAAAVVPDRTADSAAASAQGAPLVHRVLRALDERSVRYCKWKSNVRLDMTLAGAADVDLLVDRRDETGFRDAVLSEGFKPARSRAGIDHPGVIHAVGLDDDALRLVDLHACFQIISGDKLVKTYRFPVEREILERTRRLQDIKVPLAEAELVLFTLRMALRHVSPIELARATLREKIAGEFDWLLRSADLGAAAALCAEWFPEIDAAFFGRLLHVMRHGGLAARVAAGWGLAWRLRHLRRVNVVTGLSSRLWRLSTIVRNKLRRRKDLCVESGGLLVAVVGPKATGKTTMVRELATRFGQQLDVSSIHAGKPPATLLSALPNALIPLARKLMPHERLTEYERPERRAQRRYSLFYCLRMALLAHDRRKLLERAMREATNGTLVVCDRFPSATIGATDSSRFDDEALAGCGSRLKRWLMEMERRSYRSAPRADLVLRLEAPMEIALLRDQERDKEGGPNAEAVRRRWELESRGAFPGAQLVRIDTNQPLQDSVRAATRAIWAAL